MLLRSRILWVWTANWGAVFLSAVDMPNTGMGDRARLIRAFDRYQANVTPDSAQLLVMSLGPLRGITMSGYNAGGSVQLDLKTGLVTSTVKGLPLDGVVDLWLIQTQPGGGSRTLADPNDLLVKVGSYHVQSKSQM